MTEPEKAMAHLRATYEILRARGDEKQATDALFAMFGDLLAMFGEALAKAHLGTLHELERELAPRGPEVVSLVRVEASGGKHARVEVWNRGGKAGVLTVDQGDVEELVRRLAPRRREP